MKRAFRNTLFGMGAIAASVIGLKATTANASCDKPSCGPSQDPHSFFCCTDICVNNYGGGPCWDFCVICVSGGGS